MLENIKSSYDLSKEKYPKDLSADMKADYTAVAGESEDVREQVIVAYMGATGYSRRQIVGKMSRENYYVAKVRKGKDGETPAERKPVIVARIAENMGVTYDSLKTLENANKTAILIVDSFVQAVNAAEDETGE